MILDDEDVRVLRGLVEAKRAELLIAATGAGLAPWLDPAERAVKKANAHAGFAQLGAVAVKLSGEAVTFDGEYIWLLTGSHDHPENRVALDSSVYAALLKFAERAGWKAGL